jgi:ADP-heptose:LPS heptosyltransferase
MSSEPKSILAFRNGSLGNTLVAVPALRALRKRHPGARLSVVVDPVGAELLALCPWIDELIVYDKRGRDRGLVAWLSLVQALRRTKPDQAVLFKRFFRNGLLARLSGARVRIGFSTRGKAPFLNLTTPYEENESVTRLNLRLAGLSGASESDPRTELWLSDEDDKAAQIFLAERGMPAGGFLAAHYGGLSTPPNFVTPARFAALLAALGVPARPAVLVGSGARERTWADKIAAALPGVVPAHGLSLRVSAALLRRASLFVGFNSGPAHLAAAAGTRTLILFRPGPGSEAEIRKWLPLDAGARALTPPAGVAEAAWTEFFETTAALEAREASPAGAPGAGRESRSQP